jgi:hypothetical protein
VLRDLDHQRLTASAASEILGLGRRQVLRLLKAYRTSGVGGLISKQRGRPSNRRKPEAPRPPAARLQVPGGDISIQRVARHLYLG